MRGPKYRVTIYPFKDRGDLCIAEWFVERVDPDKIFRVQSGYSCKSTEDAEMQARLWIEQRKRRDDAANQRERDVCVFEVPA